MCLFFFDHGNILEVSLVIGFFLDFKLKGHSVILVFKTTLKRNYINGTLGT